MENMTPKIDLMKHRNIKTATFAMGCFWEPDAMFGIIDGVISTRVGYCGGTKESPIYDDLGNHSETIQIDYDNDRTSYEKLFERFWNKIDPYMKNQHPQYASVLFYHDEEQKRIFEKTKTEAEKNGKTVTIQCKPYHKLYFAENYHQKYYLQSNSFFMKDYKEIFSTFKDFINSTATARVNSYIKGYGSMIQLESEIDSLGLSEKNKEMLFDIVQGFQG